MAKKRRAHDEEAWRNAKKTCRLNARQVEMARVLGMNPNKLSALRTNPQQRWKLPVGEFIEQRYWRRFGGHPLDQNLQAPEPDSRKASTVHRDAHAPEGVGDAASQAADLVCYVMNLADDLQKWLAQGTVAPDVLPQVSEELREIAKALDTGAPFSPIPAIPLPPRRSRPAFSRRGDDEPTVAREVFCVECHCDCHCAGKMRNQTQTNERRRRKTKKNPYLPATFAHDVRSPTVRPVRMPSPSPRRPGQSFNRCRDLTPDAGVCDPMLRRSLPARRSDRLVPGELDMPAVWEPTAKLMLDRRDRFTQPEIAAEFDRYSNQTSELLNSSIVFDTDKAGYLTPVADRRYSVVWYLENDQPVVHAVVPTARFTPGSAGLKSRVEQIVRKASDDLIKIR